MLNSIANLFRSNADQLMFAVQNNNINEVKRLIAKGANVNEKNAFGDTPLHLASRKSIALVKLLIDGGADVSVKDDNNKTPLDYALEKGHTEIVTLLTSKRETINKKNNKELVSSLLSNSGNDTKLKHVHNLEDTVISPYKTIYLAIQQIFSALWVICLDAKQTIADFIQDAADMFSLEKEENTAEGSTQQSLSEKKENSEKSMTRSSSVSYRGSFVAGENKRNTLKDENSPWKGRT